MSAWSAIPPARRAFDATCPPCRGRSDLCRLALCRAVAFARPPAGVALELRRAALHSEQLNVAVDFADPTPGDARLQEFQVPNVLLLMKEYDLLVQLLINQSEAERTWSPMERARLLFRASRARGGPARTERGA
jgi:hypothetical protein